MNKESKCEPCTVKCKLICESKIINGKNALVYGIEATCNTTETIVYSNLSLNKDKLESLVNTINSEKVEIYHLEDIINDFLFFN